MKDYIILSNKIQCNKCKDIIESKHRHDFVSCTCGSVYVDGGKDYLRRLGNSEDYTDLSEVVSKDTTDWFEQVREVFTWKSYGKSGKEQPHYIFLKDMETQHIKNILSTQFHIKGTIVEEFFKLELRRRDDD